MQGAKGDQGPQGSQGPKGDKGDPGTSSTIAGDIDMNGHRIIGLPTPPIHDSEAATKKWVTDDFPTKREILYGFTMKGPLSLGNNEIYEVDDPTTDKSAVNRQFFDRRGAFFNNIIFILVYFVMIRTLTVKMMLW